MAKITITLQDNPDGTVHSEWNMQETEAEAGKTTRAKQLGHIVVEFMKGVFRSHLAVEAKDIGANAPEEQPNTIKYGDEGAKYGE
jgi:hypothetical protein